MHCCVICIFMIFSFPLSICTAFILTIQIPNLTYNTMRTEFLFLFFRLYHFNWNFDISTRLPNGKPVILKDTVYFYCWLIAIYRLQKFKNTMIKSNNETHNSTINLFVLMTKNVLYSHLLRSRSRFCEQRPIVCSIWRV